jgi:hypothetical protein
MGESHTASSRPANGFREHLRHAGTIVHRAHKRVLHHIRRHLCAFGRAVCGLWPVKPAAHLAHLARISERNANQLISGERKVTAKAMHVVEGEMLD